MSKTTIKSSSTSSVQQIIHSSDGKDAALAPSSGQVIATTGNVIAKTATVHGSLQTSTNVNVVIDNPA